MTKHNYGVAEAPAGEWMEAERIRDLPEVDEAIRNMLEDQTGDNSTCMVRAVLRAAGVTPDPAPGEPLRELGAYLARVLDEDQWVNAEALLLKATAGVEGRKS